MKTKEYYLKEAQLQKKYWLHLKSWFKYSLIASAIVSSLIYYAFTTSFPYVGLARIGLCGLMLALLIWIFLLNRALIHGKKNILRCLEQCENM